MSEFQPVSTKKDLCLLDMDDVLAGYRSGLDSDSEPGSDKSKGFWHGWRNGVSDRGLAPIDEDQRQLAEELYGPQRRMGMN